MRRALLVAALAAAGCGSGAHAIPSGSGPCTLPECGLAPIMLAAELTPAPTDANLFAPVELPMAAIDPSRFLFHFELPRAVQISGKVTIGAAGNARFLAGAVVATRPSRIPGRPDKSFQAQIDPVSGSYTLAVTPTQPGEHYTLRVAAADPSQLPPQSFTVDATQDTRFDLVLDDPQTLIQLHGTIADPVGHAVPGMVVRALDPASQALLSTTATTDGAGAYALRLERNLPSTTVLLTAAPGPSAPAATPALSTTVDVSKPGAASSITADVDEPPLPAAVQLTYRVSGVGSSGAEVLVAGALCRFSADVSDPAAPQVTALFAASATTGTDGSVTVALVPSSQGTRSYQLVVAPPGSSDFQRATFTIAVGQASGVGAPVMLPLRPEVTGRVLDPKGQPLAMATVQTGTSTVGALAAASLADVVNLASTLTGSDGRFVLRLDPGSYDVGVAPPAGSFFPIVWSTGVNVQSDVDLGAIALPRAAQVAVQVTSPDGQPRASAEVQLYALSPAGGCQGNQPSCLPTPRPAAAATTDGSGSAELLLPAE